MPSCPVLCELGTGIRQCCLKRSPFDLQLADGGNEGAEPMSLSSHARQLNSSRDCVICCFLMWAGVQSVLSLSSDCERVAANNQHWLCVCAKWLCLEVAV